MSSAAARANASSPHGYQSTGLSACWRRYGLVSSREAVHGAEATACARQTPRAGEGRDRAGRRRRSGAGGELGLDRREARPGSRRSRPGRRSTRSRSRAKRHQVRSSPSDAGHRRRRRRRARNRHAGIAERGPDADRRRRRRSATATTIDAVVFCCPRTCMQTVTPRWSAPGSAGGGTAPAVRVRPTARCRDRAASAITRRPDRGPRRRGRRTRRWRRGGGRRSSSGSPGGGTSGSRCRARRRRTRGSSRCRARSGSRSPRRRRPAGPPRCGRSSRRSTRRCVGDQERRVVGRVRVPLAASRPGRASRSARS